MTSETFPVTAITSTVDTTVITVIIDLKIFLPTFKDGFVKNCILEFAGPGVKNLSMDFRIGIDVMTTETTCLSSIWTTDEKTAEYLSIHGRKGEYKEIKPEDGAYYDKAIRIDLLKFQIDEIENAAIQVGEIEQLKKKREIFQKRKKTGNFSRYLENSQQSNLEIKKILKIIRK